MRWRLNCPPAVPHVRAQDDAVEEKTPDFSGLKIGTTIAREVRAHRTHRTHRILVWCGIVLGRDAHSSRSALRPATIALSYIPSALRFTKDKCERSLWGRAALHKLGRVVGCANSAQSARTLKGARLAD